MTWWDSMWAQAAGELLAGFILLPIGLYIENWLDERRTRRQNAREQVRWIQLMKPKRAKHG